MNAGGLRASIDAGNVTRSDVLTTFPFLNAATDLKLTGQQLWDLFEGMSDITYKVGINLIVLRIGAVSRKNKQGHEVTSFVQISKGMAFTWDPTRPQGSRLVALNIGQSDPIPPVDLQKTYTIATLDYIAGGGAYSHRPESSMLTVSL